MVSNLPPSASEGDARHLPMASTSKESLWMSILDLHEWFYSSLYFSDG